MYLLVCSFYQIYLDTEETLRCVAVVKEKVVILFVVNLIEIH